MEKTGRRKNCAEDAKIEDAINNPLFQDFGRLIFPVNRKYYSGTPLRIFV